MRAYILPKEGVTHLVEAVVFQNKNISLIRDDKSSFYRAIVDADQIIPIKAKALLIEGHPRITEGAKPIHEINFQYLVQLKVPVDEGFIMASVLPRLKNSLEETITDLGL